MEGNAEIVTFAALHETDKTSVIMTNHIRTIIFSAMFSFMAGGIQAAKYMMPMQHCHGIVSGTDVEQHL